MCIKPQKLGITKWASLNLDEDLRRPKTWVRQKQMTQKMFIWSPQLLVQFKNEIWTENSACEWNLKSVKMAMEVEQNQNHQLGFPFWKPLRRRFGPESPFFAHGNLERELLAKQVFFFFSFQIVWCLIKVYKYWILRWYLLLYLPFAFQSLLWN